MAWNELELRELNNDLRNDAKWGAVLNECLGGLVDYTKMPCYGNDKVVWSYHSYFESGNNRYSFYEAEMSIFDLDKRWATKRLISIMLALFFRNNMYNRLTALIEVDNRQAVRLVKLAGFTLEGIIRRPVNFKNILQFSILREDWEKGRFYG
jgi:hypothetical protein